jgi:hypothetical protein
MLTSSSYKVWQPRDYSTLPPELLQHILLHVATPEVDNLHKLSKHLFKARLVSKTFSRAVVVFLLFIRSRDRRHSTSSIGSSQIATSSSISNALTCHDISSVYGSLHLPPTNGDLKRLSRVLLNNKKIAGLITSITYHVISAPSNDIDEEWLEYEYENTDFSDCKCDDEDSDSCSSWKLCSQNVETLSRQKKIQDRFANILGTEKGVSALNRILKVLVNLRCIRFVVDDYWAVVPAYKGHDTSEDEGIARPVWRNAFPTILDTLTTLSPVTTLELCRLSSAALTTLHPAKIMTMSRHGGFLGNLTSLTLVTSHRDDMEWIANDSGEYDNDEEPILHNLRYADRINLLLYCATNLRALTIACGFEHKYAEASELEEEWVTNVLGGVSFPFLESFELREVNAEEGDAVHTFLTRHQRSLKRVVLHQINCPCDGWERLIVDLHDNFSLEEASILVDKDAAGGYPVLNQIVKDYGVDRVSEYDHWDVDVGSYVVRSKDANAELRKS